MFNGCNKLETLNLQNFNMTKVTNKWRFITVSADKVKILTNKSVYNWFKDNYPNYLNCIEIVESRYSNLNS